MFIASKMTAFFLAVLPDISTTWRILTIVVIAAAAHFGVFFLRRLTAYLVSGGQLESHPKVRSLLALISSILVFAIYFGAIGFAMSEFGISLTAYFASATVIGLAVGFGSQGVVQDVVTGITLIFSDLIRLDNMVEISGQTGIVKSIGMRFVILENPLGAKVYIPNRLIGNVINYPKGYVRCIVDVTLDADVEVREKMVAQVQAMVNNATDQFPGILVAPPSIEGVRKTSAGKEFLRVKFRVWPGRGAPLETLFRQELIKSMQNLSPNFADWMVCVLYETEKPIESRPRRVHSSQKGRKPRAKSAQSE